MRRQCSAGGDTQAAHDAGSDSHEFARAATGIAFLTAALRVTESAGPGRGGGPGGKLQKLRCPGCNTRINGNNEYAFL